MASVFYFSPHILLVSVISSLLHHPFYRNEVEHNKAETHKNLSIQNRFQKRCVCSSLLWNSSVRVAFMVNLQSRLHHHALLKPPTSSSNNLALDFFSKIKSTLTKKKKKKTLSALKLFQKLWPRQHPQGLFKYSKEWLHRYGEGISLPRVGHHTADYFTDLVFI